jgi:membrane-bound lytic murein transglycosylase D
MPDLNHDLVWQYQQSYQARPEHLRRLVERSRPYLHYVVEMLEARGMPLELAFLPMVESAYNPFAHSPAQASGLWQFIPSTGRNFELEQNWWRDQRRDVLASTRAALDYLQYIYEMHDDWHLALASYNWGEGSVKRAIARNRAKNAPTDYASLKMPRETRHYVPKLQALKNIFGNPRLYAELDLPGIPDRPYFRTLTIRAPMDISLAARFAGMTPADFFALNPGYNRPVIPAQSTLVIPDDRLEAFDKGMRWHTEPLSNWGVYSLRRGEDLTGVAARFGIKLDDLKRVNSLVGEVQPTPGLTLLVPQVGNGNKGVTEAGKLDDRAFFTLAQQGFYPVPAKRITHRVKKGETLASIARRYKTSVAELKRINRLKKNKVRKGSRLVIRGQRATPASGEHPALFSLTPGIPPSYQISDLLAAAEEMEADEPDDADDEDEPDEADEADDATEPDDSDDADETELRLRFSSVLLSPATPLPNPIPVATPVEDEKQRMDNRTPPPSAKARAASLHHTIRKGDTLSSIARRYQVSVKALRQANPSQGRTLKIGSVLTIPGNRK